MDRFPILQLQGKLQIDPMMSRLGSQQRTVDIGQFRIRETLRKDLKTLTATGFDERRNQEYVDQPIGLLAAHERVERHAVGTRPNRLVPNPTCIEQPKDLLEMIEFVAGQLGQRFLKETMMRVREKQLDCRPRRFLLAMRMIEQNLIEMCARTGQPLGRGLFCQMQHGGRV